jgi:hypothetical protein
MSHTMRPRRSNPFLPVFESCRCRAEDFSGLWIGPLERRGIIIKAAGLLQVIAAKNRVSKLLYTWVRAIGGAGSLRRSGHSTINSTIGVLSHLRQGQRMNEHRK